MVRHSVKYVTHKDRKELCKDLKSIYGAVSEEEAEAQLEAFGNRWNGKYPTVSQIWQRNWENIIPLFNYPADNRKAIYTINAIESLNRSLRKIFKTKGTFPHDESIKKIMYLALDRISKKWTMPIRNWKATLNQFAIKFEGRFSI